MYTMMNIPVMGCGPQADGVKNAPQLRSTEHIQRDDVYIVCRAKRNSEPVALSFSSYTFICPALMYCHGHARK